MMKTSESKLLLCPVRGSLTSSALAKDGLTPTEEARRIELIKFLMVRNYPASHMTVETIVVDKLGESGRNKLRCDLIVYNEPVSHLASLTPKERLSHAIAIAEVKRDAKSLRSGILYQLEPALKLLPKMQALGIYWDNVNRILLTKQLLADHTVIEQDSVENLPMYREEYKKKPLTSDLLSAPDNLFSVLTNVAHEMRSHGVNDESLRYRETVKLILARYCDERDAAKSRSGELSLQVRPGADAGFMERVEQVYKRSAKRYSKARTLFYPIPGTELPEKALRSIVKLIQGINFSAATSEVMQQVFMSFVPAVFKKSLDQYFTPASLIDCMTELVRIGPNDKIIDPGMGTADFLTSALMKRLDAGDNDIDQRIFGIDIDEKAYDLAIINMILHKDGQTGLECEDSIKNHAKYAGDFDVVLCNPPFGEKSVERRSEVLKNYDLGHVWEWGTDGWSKTSDLQTSQHLGILFLERCVKLLSTADGGGRLAIILPEGYLCTASYAYVRQWIIDNLRIVSLIELPRRIFLKSDADLRSAIVVCEKLPPAHLKKLKGADYPIHAELVRKVGYKLGGDFAVIPKKNPTTGEEIRDEDNKLVPDTHFREVTARGLQFANDWHLGESITQQLFAASEEWVGARFSDIANHPALDLKPRRLTPNALKVTRQIRSGAHVKLADIADVVTDTIDLRVESNRSTAWHLVEGQDIRAVEGTVLVQEPQFGWAIAERKGPTAYRLQPGDIVIGLVRPERRNIGMLILDDGVPAVGAPDGIAVIRVKSQNSKSYPAAWLFSALRNEASRIQFWVESGGTSYGKLNNDHINGLLLADPEEKTKHSVASQVKKWYEHHRNALHHWSQIGNEEDRKPILNSPIFGLEWPGVERDDE